MNKQELIKKYKRLEGVWDAPGAETARQIFLQDLEQLDEPEKVKVPQIVAEYIKKTKNYHWDLHEAMQWVELEDCKELKEYFYIAKNIETFARAWLDGYEKDKRYLVRIIGITNYNSYLNYHKEEDKWTIESRMEIDAIKTEHTRKELEEAGFGEVFNSPLFEVEEVEG
mgnify:CR=1 FL=1